MKRAILYASIFFSIVTVQYFYNNYAKALEQASLHNIDKAAELIGAEENSKMDADNTGLNVRDRSGLTLTPQDQSNTEADLALAQDIRKGLLADKMLSLYAQNIKIITIKGKVTLRGPVENLDEKRKAGDIAGMCAGPEKIDNQLEIKE